MLPKFFNVWLYILYHLLHPCPLRTTYYGDGRLPSTVYRREPFVDSSYPLKAFFFRARYISEILRNKVKLLFYHPIFISAQTGSGKTTFIFDDIYSLVKRKRQIARLP